MKYDDFDLVLLNRLKGLKSIALLGRDVSHFITLIGAAYKDATVRDLTFHDISNTVLSACVIVGDEIINDDMSGRLCGIEAEKIFALSRHSSLDKCSNSFIRHGFEILSANRVKINASEEETGLMFEIRKHNPERLPEAESLVKKYREVYVLCPRAIKTGGPELLHQLVYQINLLGGDAYITYIPSGEGEILTHPELEKYVYGRVRTTEEIQPGQDNLLVVPEGWPVNTDASSVIKKMFWWLSVDNFLIACKNAGMDPEKKTAEICDTYDIVACQSEYALKYVRAHGISEDRLVYLSDYLNDAFIEKKEDALSREKKDIVLYNPKKGFEYTKKLIENSSDIEFVPIENMTTSQVRDLLESAKVYIDFGDHPGKDRIPREAAISGCIVITGMKGAAGNDKDICTDPRYKLDEETVSTEKALELIRSCLKDYDERIRDFKAYRDRISGEKEEFAESVKRIFFNKR